MAIHQEPNALPCAARRPIRSLPDRPAHLGVMDINELGLEPLIGVEELAEYLGVPVQTIYDWRLSGRAPRAFKFGKHLRVRGQRRRRVAGAATRGWLRSTS